MIDSGCTLDVVGQETAEQLNLQYKPVDSSSYNIKDAGGNPVRIVGLAENVEAKIKEWTDPKPLPLLISDTLAGTDILVSWLTAMNWGFLQFPASATSGSVYKCTGVELREENALFLQNLPAMRTYSPVDPKDTDWNTKMLQKGRQIRDDLLSDYPLAFKQEGDTQTHADVEPVKISVDEGARPVNRTWCKELPPGLEKESQELVDSLLEDGTIIRVDEPTQWCAPARFVRKANGSPRLVINYQGLNASGDRVGYPFSSAEEIHHRVREGTIIFVALDLCNSYFQIPVEQESIHLLTFILPMGKFAMTRCGQGHKDSSDQLNIKTRELLSGVDRGSKIIDD